MILPIQSMQRKAKKNNKKRSAGIQNLSAKISTETPQVIKEQQTRAKYECSEELAKMIEQANLLPVDFHFSLIELIETKSSLLPSHVIIVDYLFSLPKEVRNFIFGSEEMIIYEKRDSFDYWLNNDGLAQDKLTDLNSTEEISDEAFNKLINAEADDIADFLVDYGYYGDKYSYKKQLEEERADTRRYSIFNNLEDSSSSDTELLLKAHTYIRPLERLQNIRNFLLAIINLAKHFEITSKQNKPDPYFIRKDKEKFTELAVKEFELKELQEKVLATNISINDSGEIQFSISDWAKAVQGVDITRIRLCDVCHKIFWANRRDAFACSKKHAKTRQMRLLRSNWKEKENLYLEARNKKKEKKNNGSL